jgi:hypothetical protein
MLVYFLAIWYFHSHFVHFMDNSSVLWSFDMYVCLHIYIFISGILHQKSLATQILSLVGGENFDESFYMYVHKQ